MKNITFFGILEHNPYNQIYIHKFNKIYIHEFYKPIYKFDKLYNKSEKYLKMERPDKKVFLDLNHVFGSNFALAIKNQIGLIEQDQKIKLVYTAGKTVVKRCIKTGSMQFIRLSQNIQAIQCMSISPTRSHISICEKIKNQNFLLLNLYGLKTRDSQIKHFKLPQTQKQSSFKVIAFSPSQPKYVCCMTCQPDNQLMFLDISRSRGLAVSNFSVEGAESLSICPTQSHLISCAGRNIFKMFKIEDYSFKAYDDVKKLPKTRNFTAHAWFDKTKILVGTDRGQLFMIGPVGNNFQVKRHFNNVFAMQSVHQIGVSAICVFAKGFILGSTFGNFSLWVKSQQNQQNFQDEYTGDLTKKWKMPQGKCSQVTSIAVCPLQQNIAVSFKNNSIALTTMQILMSVQQVDINVSLNDQILSVINQGFHTSPIDSMDICMHRPLIATLSKKQNSIRIWNYKNPQCQLTKIMDTKVDGIQDVGAVELVNCLAFHPLGYYMAIGCCDKLRFYHVLQSGLRNYREIVLRAVVQVKFSNGGHLLAAAYPRQKHNIHQINIYNSYTLQQLARLSDHSNLITELFWKFDDKFLYSVGIDGTIAQWKYQSKDNKQWAFRKWNQNNSKYTSIIHERNAKSILAVGNQLNKFIVREIKTQKEQAQKLFTTNFRMCKLQWLVSQWNIPAILGGTQDGILKIFNSSFDNIVQQSLNIHMKEITSIQCSPCGRYVITCGKDGLIFLYQVSLTNRDGFVNKRMHDQLSNNNQLELNPLVGVVDDQLAQVVLVQRNQVNQKIRYTKLLEKNLEDLKRKLVIQDDDQNRKYQSQLKLLTHQKQLTINKLTIQLENVKNQKKNLQTMFESSYVNTQSKNNKMLQDVESLFEKKLAIQNRKYFNLQKQYEQEQKRQEVELTLLNNKTNQTIQMLKKQFTQCFKKAQRVHHNQQDGMVLSEKSFSQKVNQLQEEHQNELKKVSQNIVEIQTQKTKKSAEYANIIESMKRDCRMLNEEIIQFMSESQHLRSLTNQLQYQLMNINNSMNAKKNQLTQKQQNLKTRQDKIGVFQQKISQLQKKKTVLSYRTWQMRQDIQPKQDEIDFLKQQIFNLQSEFQTLLQQQKTIQHLQLRTKQQKQELNQLIQKQKAITKDKKIKIKKISDDINDVVNITQDKTKKVVQKKDYEKQLRKLYQKYGHLMTQSKKNNTNVKGIQQMNRHMNHLDQQIQQSNKKTQITVKSRDSQIQRSTQQNADLIKQLTLFRAQKQQKSNQLKNLQKIVETLRRQSTQLKALMQSNHLKQQKQSQYLGTSLKRTSTSKLPANQPINQPPTHPSIALIRSSSQPIHKGRLVKGINYDAQSLSIFSKAKIKDLENQLQLIKYNLKNKEINAKTFKNQLILHLNTCQCEDVNNLNRIFNQYQF